MKYYTSTTEYNAGVDLHSRNMYLCLMDRAGKILVHENIKSNDLEYLKRLIAPYRHDLTLTFESCFMGAWFADFCQDEALPHVMAHAFYLHSIQGSKHKNDKRDSQELADCLRTNRIPPAYVCPRNISRTGPTVPVPCVLSSPAASRHGRRGVFGTPGWCATAAQ